MLKKIIKSLKPSSTLRINEISNKLENDGKEISNEDIQLAFRNANEKNTNSSSPETQTSGNQPQSQPTKTSALSGFGIPNPFGK